VRVREEVTVIVCDDAGDEHEVSAVLDGLWTQPSRFDPGETPEAMISRDVPAALHEEAARVAWEVWLENHYRGEDRY